MVNRVVTKIDGRFFDVGERLLARLACLGLLCLLIAQTIMMHDRLRPYLSYVERLEGKAVHLERHRTAEAPLAVKEKSVLALPLPRTGKIIVIKLIGAAPRETVQVLVNGKQAGRFRERDVKILAQDGDLVEIDATAVPEPLTFTVAVPTGGLEYPDDGLVIETRGNIETLGKVRFRR